MKYMKLIVFCIILSNCTTTNTTLKDRKLFDEHQKVATENQRRADRQQQKQYDDILKQQSRFFDNRK